MACKAAMNNMYVICSYMSTGKEKLLVENIVSERLFYYLSDISTLFTFVSGKPAIDQITGNTVGNILRLAPSAERDPHVDEHMLNMCLAFFRIHMQIIW